MTMSRRFFFIQKRGHDTKRTLYQAELGKAIKTFEPDPTREGISL